MYLSKNRFQIYYLYYTDEFTGKIRKVSTRTKLKSEALKFVKNFHTPPQEEVTGKSYKICKFQEEVLRYIQNTFTSSTYQIYRNTFKTFSAFIGNKNITSISVKDIEGYKAHRLNEVNKTTCNIDIRTLKAIFNLACKWEILHKNPCANVKQFQLDEREILCFSDYEIQLLLNSIEDTDFKNMIIFVLCTGLRISELLNVQHKDINLNEKLLIIRNKGEFRTKSGKNRIIPLNETLYRILVNYNHDNLDNYLFRDKADNKFNRTYITKKFKKYLRKNNLPEKYHFHCLRHTFITNLIKKDVNVNFIKELAGHAEIETTLNYVHIVTNDLKDAVNKIAI